MSKGSSLIKGTLILSGATLLTKALGTLFWLPFQNIAGDAAMGIYRQSFPFYSILLMIATAGVPITVSKLISQRLPAGDHAGANRVMRVSASMLSLTGLGGFFLLFFGSGVIARFVLDNPRTEPSLRVLSFALLIVPIMAVLRGYFQGHQKMMPTALSQVMEQSVRVLTMVAVTWWMVDQGNGPETVAAGATLGAVTGAAGGLLIVLLYRRGERVRHPISAEAMYQATVAEPFTGLSRRILRFAVPISLGSLVLPLINILDSVTVPRILLKSFDMSIGQAEILFGVYGRGEPLINLVATFSSALTLALIPALSFHLSRGENEAIRRKIPRAWLLTVVVSFPSAIGLAILAQPLNLMLYHNRSEAILTTATMIVTVQAFSSFFSTLAITNSGILQGLGYNRLPVRHLGVGAIVKVIGNMVFIPFLGITGSALAMLLAYMLVCTLHFRSVTRNTGLRINYRSLFVKPAFCTGVMATFLLAVLTAINHFAGPGMDRLANTWLTLLLSGFGFLIYTTALLLTGTIGEEEIRLLPMGALLCRLLTRYKLLRPTGGSFS
ncbi:putative polysaccharide biosynthesis protein [Salinithrix halophila]|uniref:Oligosaccharide flippase family protein n=1 Tax=Salinithrix halophila TaxID=1485204 RepID=A0ABV8JKG3_9BACL